MRKLSTMTLQEKIGQLFMFGFKDLNAALKLIEKYKLGNIIYFRRNLDNGENIAKMSKLLQDTVVQHTQIPAIVAADHEGGLVNRFEEGATLFPGAMAISAAGDAQYAYEVGRRSAEELLQYGVNMNLAPVLDINSNPKNPVIGVRSFSDDKDVVKEYGYQQTKGMQEVGLMGCGKHFPGHGDTSMDSHIALPVIEHDAQRMDQEMEPFAYVIDQGIASIMAAHILLPALEEKKVPATMSKSILTGILREKLGFDGLILTDCLEMHAVSKYYGVPEGAVKALQAGSDILCISHTEDYQVAAYEAIMKAIQDGEIAMEAIDEKVERILRYKEQYNLMESIQKIQPVSTEQLEENEVFANEISRKAVTVVRDRKQLLPIAADDNVMVISPIRSMFTGIDGDVSTCDFAGLAAAQMGCDHEALANMDEMTDAQWEDIYARCAKADKVIVGTYNAMLIEQQQTLLRKLYSVNPNIIMVALRIPYDVSIMADEIGTAICIYDYTETAAKNLVDGLMGRYPMAGQLPVQIR